MVSTQALRRHHNLLGSVVRASRTPCPPPGHHPAADASPSPPLFSFVAAAAAVGSGGGRAFLTSAPMPPLPAPAAGRQSQQRVPSLASPVSSEAGAPALAFGPVADADNEDGPQLVMLFTHTMEISFFIRMYMFHIKFELYLT